MITYFEHPKPGYGPRTFQNASAADLTIALAVDFTTAGERLTKNAVKNAGNKYMAIDVLKDWSPQRIHKIWEFIYNNVGESFSLNIAGNGIYTLHSHGIGQSDCDKYMIHFISMLNREFDITSARNGGQTGFDEAGGKATSHFGIPTTICAPKGWMFRGLDGRDVCNEELFKKRFQ